MLKYPTFANEHEWDSLKNDLSVVDFYLQLSALEQALADAEKHRDGLLKARKLSCANTAERLRQLGQDVSNQCQGNYEFTENKADILRGMLDKLRQHQSGREGQLIAEGVQRGLKAMYTLVDVSAFNSDLETCLSSIAEQVPSDDDVQAAHGSVGQCVRKVNEHWKGCLQVFKGERLPSKEWREMKLPFGASVDDPLACKAIAGAIIRAFVKTWESRAPMFAEPVSISGVLIESMPESRRQLWKSKYDALELGRIVKRPYFEGIRSNEQSVCTPAPAPQPERRSMFGLFSL